MSHTFTLPIRQPNASETVSFRVDWGDSTSEIFTFDGNTWSTQDFSHYYSNNNLKTIKIYPPLGEKFGKYWGFGHANATNSAAQMRHITKWGGFEFGFAGGSFKNCVNLDFGSNLTGTPAITYPDSLMSAFSGCTSFAPESAHLAYWNTLAAQTFYETFLNCINLNASVNGWNPSNVTNTTRMFAGCDIFNQSFGSWNSAGRNTANLVTATSMFEGASSFNGSLANWNISKLVHIDQMFKSATNFASQIFANYDSTGTVSSGPATSLEGIFLGTKFNGVNITTWDVSAISNFHGVFRNNTHFNQDIGDWDVGEGTIFESMLNGATSFNRDISQWDTSKGTNFNSMFEGATIFNQNINTGASTTLHGATYNPWTIGTATMDNMLHDAAAFNQDLSGWNMTNVSSAINLLDGTDLSAENAAAINDSGTGWPSQSGVSAAVTNESAAAVQASGTVPVITSHTAAGGTIISNPENTQTVVNLVAAGSPTPTLSMSYWGADHSSPGAPTVSNVIDLPRFTLVDNGNGTGTLKLTNAPDYEIPTDTSGWGGYEGQNTYAVYVDATNSLGSGSHLFQFNVTNVADAVTPDITGLHIDNTDLTTIQFGWDGLPNVASPSYQYQVSTSSDFSGIIAAGTHNTNTLNVTGLSPATPYYFNVKGNGGGTGSTYEVDSLNWTTISSVTAGAAATYTSHSTTENIIITNPENTQTVVTLAASGTPTPAFSMHNSLDSSKFTLVDNNNGTATLKLTSAPNYESPTDTSYNAANTYWVGVEATNSLGEQQALFNFNVTDVADVVAPYPVGLQSSNIESHSATFSWAAVSNAASYQYEVSTNSSFSVIVASGMHSANSGARRYLDVTGLNGGTAYWFRVRVNGGGIGATYELNSNWSTAADTNITTADATVAPTWVNRGSGSTVTELIDQSSNPNQWSTYYDNDENTIETVYFEAAGTPTPSFSIKTGTGAYDGDMFTLVDHGNGTGLIKLTNPIDYENRPYNYGYGTGHYSAVVVAENTHNGNNTTIETIFTVFPKNVSDVAAPAVTSQPTTNLTSTSFFINWSSVGSGVRYTYEFASDSGFNSILRQDNDYGGIYVTTSGAGLTLTPETTYYFRVKANGGGVGSTYEVDGPWTTWSIVTPEAPELGVSTSYNWLSDATDGSGNPQPHLIPDFSTPTATLVAPAEYASDVYAGNHHYTSHYYQFGSGGTAIDGGVCAVIAPMGDNYPGYSNGEQTTPYGQVFIYERSGGAWSYSTSFGGIPGNPNWAPFNSDDSTWSNGYAGSSLNIHLGGADSTTGSALAVHNGRVFVASGGSEKSIYIFSKDAGTWSLEARIRGYQGSAGSLIDAGEDLTAPYYSNVSLSVHGGIIAMGLHRAPGDLGHNPTNMWRGIVAVYVAPSKDEFISGARGQTVPWTYWMSPGAYATDHPEFGHSVAAHDGRASGGQSVIVAGVGDTDTTASANRNSHYYFLGTPSASFNSSFGIVDPSGVIGTGNEGSYADKYYAKTQSSLCGWGNDITLLASQEWADGLSNQERLYQLDPAGGSWGFSFMQYINSHWGENNIFGSPESRGYATILADRLIVASANPSSTSSPIRKVWMREQTGAGGTSQAIAQGDYFMDGFDGGLPHLSPSGGSIDGGGVNSVDSDNADFEGYVNFHGDLSSYWTANQSSLESTYGNKRGWGEAHWYQSGIKEGREMKYQLTTYDYDLGVKIYEA